MLVTLKVKVLTHTLTGVINYFVIIILICQADKYQEYRKLSN